MSTRITVQSVSPDKSLDCESKAVAASGGRCKKFTDMFRYMDSADWVVFTIGAFFAIIHGTSMPCFALFFGDATNAIGDSSGQGFLDEMLAAVWKMGIIAGIVFVSGSMHTMCFTLIAERSAQRLREEYFTCILSRDMSWFDVNDAATIPSKLISQVASFQDAIGDKFGRLIMVTAQFYSGIGIGIWLNWSMGLLLIGACMPLVGIGGFGFAKNMEKLKMEGGHGYGRARAVAEEALFSIKTVAAFGGERREIQRYSEPLVYAKKSGISLSAWTGTFFGLIFAGFGVGYAAIFWYAGTDVVFRQENPHAAEGSFDLYDGGSIMTVFFSTLMGLMAVSDAGQPVGSLFEGMGAAALIFHTMDIEPANEDDGKNTPARIAKREKEANAWTKLLESNGADHSVKILRIEYKNVRFTYPSRQDQLILNGLDLVIQGGQKVALVGESGSGKSTCMQLLEKFYNTDQGELLITGPNGTVNIKSLPASRWRQLIGYVGQEPVLFKGSIKANITSLDHTISMEDIIRAARSAEALDFIKDKARESGTTKDFDSSDGEDAIIRAGLDTPLGQGGGGLSGGQKQRIAIARAIVQRNKRKVLLLDEATSALDNKTEQDVQSTIDKVVAEQKMTTITIAHRLSTIKTSDTIFVLHQGTVVDQGTHDELVADRGVSKSGVYAALWAGQAQQGATEEKKSEEKADFAKEDSDRIPITTGNSFLSNPDIKDEIQDEKKTKKGWCGGQASGPKKPDDLAIIQNLIDQYGQELDPLGDMAIRMLLEHENAPALDDKAVEARRLQVMQNKNVYALVGQKVKEIHSITDYHKLVGAGNCVVCYYSKKKQAMPKFGELSSKFKTVKFYQIDLDKVPLVTGKGNTSLMKYSRKLPFCSIFPDNNTKGGDVMTAETPKTLVHMVYNRFSTVLVMNAGNEKRNNQRFHELCEDNWIVAVGGIHASAKKTTEFAQLAAEFDNVAFVQHQLEDHGPDKFSIYKQNHPVHFGDIHTIKELEQRLVGLGGRKVLTQLSKWNDLILKYSGHLLWLYFIGGLVAFVSGANFPMQGYFLADGIASLSTCMPCFVSLYPQKFNAINGGPEFYPTPEQVEFLLQPFGWTADTCQRLCLDKTTDDCSRVALFFLILAIAAVFAEFFTSYVFGYIGETITQKLRVDAFSATIKQAVGFHDDPQNTPGSLTANLEYKTSRVSKIAGPNLGKFLATNSGLLSGIIFGYVFGDAILASIILAMVPFLLFALIFVLTLMYVGEASGASPFSEAGQISSEAIMNVRTVRALTNEAVTVKRFMDICEPVTKKVQNNCWKTGLAFGFSQAIFFCIYMAAFGFGGVLVRYNGADANDIFKTLFLIMFGVMGAGLAAATLPDVMRANVALYDIFKIIHKKSDINVFEPNGSRVVFAQQSEALVAFDKVEFWYPHRPNVIVLKQLSFEVSQGQTVAFVGPSGSGKTTVIQMLQRFYDPQGGSVLVGGVDLRKYDISFWRQQIGFVGQEPVLFNLTVEENIRYGKLHAQGGEISRKEVIEVAKVANCNFLEEVGATHVGQAGRRASLSSVSLLNSVGSFGGKLSGGQKQRVAIARAMIRDPKILLFDEATSALDTTSEKVVQEALQQVVAHRLSTIQDANVIMVLSGGMIVESGTHSQLLSKNGTYTKLFEAAKKSKV